jgi:hypothetical protein
MHYVAPMKECEHKLLKYYESAFIPKILVIPIHPQALQNVWCTTMLDSTYGMCAHMRVWGG